jgi:hypothetical protein
MTATPHGWPKYCADSLRVAAIAALSLAAHLLTAQAAPPTVPPAQPATQPATPASTPSTTPVPAPPAAGQSATSGNTPSSVAGSAPSSDAPSFITPPVAIVPLDGKIKGAASLVTGALQVWNGRAYMTSSGTISAGADTAQVTLPYRGTLRICASTTVKLATDSSVPAGEAPGLLMAIDHGAIETSFATGRNADVVMTPDFRILIGGPGASELKVRLGEGGDTCIDNAGADAPYVVVTSLFDSGLYRVQPGQRVMFQHGSLRDVVDQEKEPCGCPAPPPGPPGNEFPLAQSEGLAPTPPPKSAPQQPGGLSPQATAPLVYMGTDHAAETVPLPQQPAAATTVPAAQAVSPAKKKKPGAFSKIGHFFRRLFGAES